MVFSDALLARRLETAEAAIARGCTAVHPAAAVMELGTGWAVFVGAESPLSHAVGIGLTVTLACDMRIASERAQFSARFVKVGLTPECGSTRYLPLVAGMGNALFMALTGRMVDATEAKERGIVDRVVPHDSLLPEAMEVAGEIAANPPSAVWLAKRLIHENANESDLRRVVSSEGFAIREARRQPDHAEAVQAFVEKRAPNFGG